MSLIRPQALLIVYAAFFATLAAFYFLEYPLPGFGSALLNVAWAAGLMVLLAGLGRRLLRRVAPTVFDDLGGDPERLLFSIGVGAVPFALALLALGVSGQFNRGAFLVLTVGAAVLAARGAQRARPGLITVQTPPAVYVPVASQLQSVMVRPWRMRAAWPESCTAILCGPGLAAPDARHELAAEVVSLWQESDLPVVVD
ncbi:MAG TPA: NAD(P)H-hydrate dehydratase, partial [Elusimicrobiota bacterium]|nr:NAD(P)H-hydrate dehydratase [Elusimicrobiota bacterium]